MVPHQQFNLQEITGKLYKVEEMNQDIQTVQLWQVEIKQEQVIQEKEAETTQMPVVEMVTAVQVPEKIQVDLEEVQVEDKEREQVMEKVKIQMYVMKEKTLRYPIIQTWNILLQHKDSEIKVLL